MGLVLLENDASSKIANFLGATIVEKSPRFKHLSICFGFLFHSLSKLVPLVITRKKDGHRMAFDGWEWYF